MSKQSRKLSRKRSQHLDTNLPPELECSDNMEYEQELVSSLDIQISGPSFAPQAPPKSPPNPQEDEQPEPSRPPTLKTRLSIFVAQWGGLRHKCDSPKTTTKVVETMRTEALECLITSQLVSQEVVDLLDNNWDQLGTERVVKFLNLFLLHREDNRLASGDSPYAYLKGLIDSTVVSQRVVLSDLMERMATVTADLTLASDATTTYRKSLTSAEESWREQSSLISGYICKVEGQMKTLVSLLDTIQSREAEIKKSIKPPTTSKYQDSAVTINRFGDYYYEEEPSGRILVRTTSVINPTVSKIISQIQQFLDKHPKPLEITRVDPDLLAKGFWKAYKTNEGLTPIQLVDAVVVSLSPEDSNGSDKSDSEGN